jgi:hypothetical protein
MAKDVKPQPKDICFVIDTSGSMAESGGKKLQQAKKALSFCLANLNAEDRFEIVRFSTEAEGLFDKLVDASKENVKKAQDFVESLKPRAEPRSAMRSIKPSQRTRATPSAPTRSSSSPMANPPSARPTKTSSSGDSRSLTIKTCTCSPSASAPM